MSVFHNWLLEIACENYFVYIKRLSANDTGATGGHQVGLYIPSGIVEKLFPSINHTRELNPSVFLTAHVSSHDCPDSEARAIYYNSRHFGKTRNEKRITRWGRGSPLQNPENTGALTLLAFKLDEQGGDCKEVNIWVCASTDEEDVIETAIGEVIPGALISGPAGQILGGLSLQQAPVNHKGTVAKLAMRQPFVLFKGLTFQKLCLPGAFRPGDHHNKMLRPGLCVVHASPQYL